MKMIFALLFVSSTALAQVPGPHWQCFSSGINEQNALVNFDGDFKSTQDQAAANALQKCIDAGLDGCLVEFCFDDGLGYRF